MCQNCEKGLHTKCYGSLIYGDRGDGCECHCPMNTDFEVINTIKLSKKAIQEGKEIMAD